MSHMTGCNVERDVPCSNSAREMQGKTGSHELRLGAREVPSDLERDVAHAAGRDRSVPRQITQASAA